MLSRWQHYARDHPHIVDAAVVFVVAAISLPGVTLSVPGAAEPSRTPGMLLTGAACLSLLGHRSHPKATAAVTVACTIALASLGYLLTPLLLAPAMTALFSLAMRSSYKTSGIFAAVTIAAVVPAAVLAGPGSETLALKVFGPAAWLLLGPALGLAARLRLAYAEAAHARAEYAERTRDEEARHRVAEERVRIARELHDVVAHHLALANAQAGAVAHLISTDPGKAGKIAADLTGTTSSALRELKATVGLLRQVGDPDTPLEPAPGLAQLSHLTGSFSSAGLSVTVTTSGEPQQLSPGADLAAFRIIQEALTNVTKHTSSREAQVRLRYSADRVGISITNDDEPAQGGEGAAASGYGIIGMRERAQSTGGWLRAGARPRGGFEVAAELPLRTRPPGEDMPITEGDQVP